MDDVIIPPRVVLEKVTGKDWLFPRTRGFAFGVGGVV